MEQDNIDLYICAEKYCHYALSSKEKLFSHLKNSHGQVVSFISDIMPASKVRKPWSYSLVFEMDEKTKEYSIFSWMPNPPIQYRCGFCNQKQEFEQEAEYETHLLQRHYMTHYKIGLRREYERQQHHQHQNPLLPIYVPTPDIRKLMYFDIFRVPRNKIYEI